MPVRRTDGLAEGQMDRRIDGWADGRLDEAHQGQPHVAAASFKCLERATAVGLESLRVCLGVVGDVATMVAEVLK